MKQKFIYLTTLFLLITSGCSQFNSATVKANENPPFNNPGNLENRANENQTNDNRQIVQNKIKLTKVDSKSPLIWIGDISDNDLMTNGTIQKNTSYSILTKSPLDRLGLTFEVDVINCGGYLYSAIMSKYNDDTGEISEERWQYEVLPETIAPDAAAKIKQCDAFQKQTPDNIVTTETLAIAPHDENRRNIKTGTIDLSKIFASLPDSAKKLVDPNTREQSAEPKLKKKLMMGTSGTWVNTDNWIDYNGDGEIDFVKVVGFDRKSLKDGAENALVYLYFQRINGKWKELKFAKEE